MIFDKCLTKIKKYLLYVEYQRWQLMPIFLSIFFLKILFFLFNPIFLKSFHFQIHYLRFKNIASKILSINIYIFTVWNLSCSDRFSICLWSKCHLLIFITFFWKSVVKLIRQTHFFEYLIKFTIGMRTSMNFYIFRRWSFFNGRNIDLKNLAILLFLVIFLYFHF
jgi:hypothetical protein